MSRLSKTKRKFFRNLEHSIYVYFVTSYNLDYRCPLVRVIPYEKTYDVSVCLPFFMGGTSVHLYYEYDNILLNDVLSSDTPVDPIDTTADMIVEEILKQLNKVKEANNGK